MAASRISFLTTQFFVAIACILSAESAYAQAIRPIPTTPDGAFIGITVTGHGEIKESPDVAFATLAVATQSRDQIAAVKENATDTTSVMAVLTKSGIASTDIHTDYYTVQPTYDYNSTPPVLTGYSVTNSIRITIRNIAKSGLILDKAVQAGATSADGLSFDLSDKNKAQGEALVAAVANARSKADLIAGASGVGLGRILAVSESGTESQPPVFRPMMMRAAEAAPAQPTTPVSPQEITITSDVTATFSIDYSH